MTRRLWTRRAVVGSGVLGVFAFLSWQYRVRDRLPSLVRRIVARRASSVRIARGELDRFVDAYVRIDGFRLEELRERLPLDRFYGLPFYERLIPEGAAHDLELAERHVVTALLQSTDYFSSGGEANVRFVSWPRDCWNPYARTRASLRS